MTHRPLCAVSDLRLQLTEAEHHRFGSKSLGGNRDVNDARQEPNTTNSLCDDIEVPANPKSGSTASVRSRGLRSSRRTMVNCQKADRFTPMKAKKAPKLTSSPACS